VVAHDWNHLEQAVRLASAAVSPQAERAVAAQVEELAGVLRARRARGTEVPGA
jgi:hypothetical protein